MIRRGTAYGEFEVYHQEQDTYYTIEVQINYTDDSGVWYDSNGDGCPPSLEWDYKIISCTDDEGNDGCNDEWITYELIEDELQNIITKEL